MDWAGAISGILAALVAAIGIPLALRKRKKTAQLNVEQFSQHLLKIGVEASLAENGGKVKRSLGQRVEGVVSIKGRNIDFVNVISVSSQYGVNYFLDYLVASPGWTGKKRKKTRMAVKKSAAVGGNITDIEWKGDDYLSQTLNYDYQLKDKLLQSELKELKGGISVYPEPKHEYARVRTTYLLPSDDLFEAIDIIARYVKSGW